MNIVKSIMIVFALTFFGCASTNSNMKAEVNKMDQGLTDVMKKVEDQFAGVISEGLGQLVEVSHDEVVFADEYKVALVRMWVNNGQFKTKCFVVYSRNTSKEWIPVAHYFVPGRVELK